VRLKEGAGEERTEVIILFPSRPVWLDLPPTRYGTSSRRLKVLADVQDSVSDACLSTSPQRSIGD